MYGEQQRARVQVVPCKGCREAVHTEESQIERFLERMAKGGNVPFVSDGEAAARLRHCEQCTSLQGGTTCRYCGCYVKIRTKLRDSYCPDPVAAKW
ncbi:hypothetical protein [Cohnella mopanensis]|uniref:hypothetical protein n=1 Tax=Cohnella mopanensis TaxID=2911966 RepID=UPI001EF88D1D|nr:hypothetical protein [Cohnella mopanensis]